MPRRPSRRAAHPLRRSSLTRRFATISLLGLLAVAVSLVVATSQVLASQALDEGIHTAETLAGWTRGAVPVEAYSSGVLPPGTADQVRAEIAAADPRLVGLRLWTVDGTVLLDSSATASSGFADMDRLDAAALRGVPSAATRKHVVSPGDGGAGTGGAGSAADASSVSSVVPVIDVYVPVVYDGQVVGAAEVLLDHSVTAAAQAGAVRTLGLSTALGLLLLWLVLYRTVRTASHSLQETAMENARLALLDALTGLPNRRMLLDRLDRAVEARPDDQSVALLLLDMDRFKEINDSLGHDRGDELLVQVSHRLLDAFRGRDLVARLGGDEFAVLLPAVSSVEDAGHLAQRARSAFASPFDLGGMNLHVETSIGVALLPDHTDSATDLMRKADVAMYAAKQHRLGVAVYSASEDGSSPARLVLQAELHRALTRPGELTMHYQPKVDLVDGRVVGLEALMRWHHPVRGEVDPAVFIPLAEQSGLIEDLTAFALRTVVAQLAAWGPRDALPVAVNLSAHCVTSPELLPGIQGLLADHGVPVELLEVEVTETALVSDPTRVLPVIASLSAAGVQVAIDDFGIGNTSISQLRGLPVGVLKIDRLFVQDLRHEATTPGAAAVVKAMVDLAHSFGMRVVAEGVEDAGTARRLGTLGVDHAQGFWFSPAVTADEALGLRGAVPV